MEKTRFNSRQVKMNPHVCMQYMSVVLVKGTFLTVLYSLIGRGTTPFFSQFRSLLEGHYANLVFLNVFPIMITYSHIHF